jgi:hypothetical protein
MSPQATSGKRPGEHIVSGPRPLQAFVCGAGRHELFRNWLSALSVENIGIGVMTASRVRQFRTRFGRAIDDWRKARSQIR